MSHASEPAPREDLRGESLGTLMKTLSSDLSTLVRQELDLAKAEMTQKGKQAGLGAGLFGGAGITGLLTLGTLTALLVIVLDLAMPLWLAALIVFALWAVVTGVLALVGRAKLKQAGPPVPEQTVETVKEDVQWAKTQLSSDSK